MIFALLLVSQALYVHFLFERFRRKVYLDVMDFVIERRKKESGGNEDDDPSIEKRAGLKLIRRM